MQNYSFSLIIDKVKEDSVEVSLELNNEVYLNFKDITIKKGESLKIKDILVFDLPGLLQPFPRIVKTFNKESK